MDPVTIIALVTGLEQAIAGIYQIIQNAGLSADDAQVYIARIAAAGGPTNTSPASAQASAKPAFSERKP